MVHDFTLVYALASGMGSQEDVLRQVADSDSANATVGYLMVTSSPNGAVPAQPHVRSAGRVGLR